MQFLICTVDATPCPPEALSYLSMSEAINPATLGITPESVLYAFSWGMGAVILFWLIGFVTGVAVDAIKKA
ncbi:hypothetical protein SAMN05216350_1216 [Polaromonas sp. YR568]|nr:hypothetical protein SAMN05216350_1216 [Polaromonas sp. YR568]